MKRITAVFLALFLAAFLGACSGLQSGTTVALVNGKSVTQADLSTRMKVYELFFRQPMDNPGSRQQLIDQMINERLILEQAGELAVAVSDAQVENEMGRFFGALDRQYGSREEVMKKLQGLGLTNDTIVAFLQDSLTSQTVVEQKKAAVSLTPAEVKAFYDENAKDLYTPKEAVVRAAHVLLPLDQPEKAQEIAAKAKAGGNFAELAKLYSVDPGSSRTGGDLGYFTRGTMVEEFADATFSLQAGEISQPVKSQFGWHVVQLLDRRGPGLIPFEAAKMDAANRLLPRKQDQAFEQWLQSLQKAAKVEKTNLAESPAKS